MDCQAQTGRDFYCEILFNDARAMTHRTIEETVGIADQFKATGLLIDNDWAGSHSERMEGRAFRTTFAIERILRYDEIISRPRRATGMGVPNDAANSLSILRHMCRQRGDTRVFH